MYLFLIKGRIECNSLDSEDGLSRGKTDCTIDKPIFKSMSKVCVFCTAASPLAAAETVGQNVEGI